MRFWLGSATLSQQAFPGEKRSEFPTKEVPMVQYSYKVKQGRRKERDPLNDCVRGKFCQMKLPVIVLPSQNRRHGSLGKPTAVTSLRVNTGLAFHSVTRPGSKYTCSRVKPAWPTEKYAVSRGQDWYNIPSPNTTLSSQECIRSSWTGAFEAVGWFRCTQL